MLRSLCGESKVQRKHTRCCTIFVKMIQEQEYVSVYFATTAVKTEEKHNYLLGKFKAL